MYFGIRNGLDHVLKEVSQPFDELLLSFNIDGIPAFRSKGIQVWPIQVTVDNILEISKSAFVVALFSGPHKPTTTDFLEDTINECIKLVNEGYSGKIIQINNIICDAPARAIVKSIYQFNGTFGCDYCDVKGKKEGGMLFLQKGNDRTDLSFRQRTNTGHHKGKSPFENLAIDMVEQFPLDPMHAVDLGVVKRIIMV